ncbi:alpha/beta fold hydrolase [Poseidonocella sedimentorum]|uniref:Pimeloyl-ACP methyl ester carboxylesterase n=1 Tax=Poseidonocella sedimentorum TaxID=871652 RepID=A0A1I6E7Z3_9RHOB|nr:alpha/beta fold hydrolase [Poseidonocella sedimentorum]SFR13777.1 Pimeloyl-ACP methyl ester carboxylesterase [Poseidonocella sedimentorum]
MAEILLVHGSWHGAWCWRDLIPELAARGHSARAIDLPGHGDDPTPLPQATLERYAEAILAALAGPTVVVGHSMAGYPISLAAERDARNITQLIYLCAYVPAPGQSLADRRRAAPRQPLMHAITVDRASGSFIVDPAKARTVFYQDCPPETVDYATARLGPEAILPQETAVTLGPTYARVPRHYIRCLRDQAIPPEFQVTMTEDWPPAQISEIDTGHSPFFAAPARLADLIDAALRQ